MSAYWGTEDESAYVGSLQLGAGTTAVVWPGVGRPVDIKRIVLAMTAAQATAGSVVTIARRTVDNNNSVNVGTFTTPAVMAVNGVFHVDVGVTSTTTTTVYSQPVEVLGRTNVMYQSEPGLIELNPGQELVLTSDGAGDTGVADAYIEFVVQGNNPLRSGNGAYPTKITYVSA